MPALFYLLQEFLLAYNSFAVKQINEGIRLNDFGRLFLEFAENVSYVNGCIPIFSETSVKRHDLHFIIFSEKSKPEPLKNNIAWLNQSDSIEIDQADIALLKARCVDN
jgi:hypothetical protein